MFQQETEASTLLGGNRLSADQKGKLWEFWPHFPLSLQHCDYTTTRRLTVVVGLVLRLQPRDGQGGRVGGAVYGAREPIRNPGGSFVIFIDHSPGATAWPLLVPVHIVAPKSAAAAGARDGDCLSQRPRHRLGLSQHKLGPRPCKEGATQRSVRSGQTLFPGREERSWTQGTNSRPPRLPLRPHLCSEPGG